MSISARNGQETDAKTVKAPKSLHALSRELKGLAGHVEKALLRNERLTQSSKQKLTLKKAEWVEAYPRSEQLVASVLPILSEAIVREIERIDDMVTTLTQNNEDGNWLEHTSSVPGRSPTRLSEIDLKLEMLRRGFPTVDRASDRDLIAEMATRGYEVRRQNLALEEGAAPEKIASEGRTSGIKIGDHPEKINIQKILTVLNAKQRSVIVAHYGLDRLMLQTLRQIASRQHKSLTVITVEHDEAMETLATRKNIAFLKEFLRTNHEMDGINHYQRLARAIIVYCEKPKT